MHCFSSGRELAEAALDLGFYISLSGIVTFKNAEELRAIVRDLPLDRLLVETDAPYLAPVPLSRQAQRAGLCRPHRGARRRAQGRRGRGARRGDHARISSACSPRRSRRPQGVGMKVTMLGCGAVLGRAAIGARLGRAAIRPTRATGAAACSVLVEDAGTRHPDRHLARSARAASRRRRRAARRRAVHPCPCRPSARHRRSALGQPADAASAIPLYADARDAGRDRRGASAMSSRRSSRGGAASTSRPSSRTTIDGPFDGRRHRRSCRSRRITASARRSGFRIGALWLFDRRDRARRCGLRGARRHRALDRRLPAPRAASDAQPSREDAGWIARVKPRRAVLTHMDESLDYATLCAEAAAGRRARL